MKDKKTEPNDDKKIAEYFTKEFSDVVRSPFLILDQNLKVVKASQYFCEYSQTSREQTEDAYVYDLGNGQWDIPELRKLLECILPKQKLVTDFEVDHKFPKLGKRIMLLNAHQLDSTKQILLSIEDITLQKEIEAKMDEYTKELEKSAARKPIELQARFDELLKLNKIISAQERKLIFLREEIFDLKKDKK